MATATYSRETGRRTDRTRFACLGSRRRATIGSVGTRQAKAGIRRDSALLRRCVEQVLGNSTVTALVEGPWRTGARPLKRPGRGGLRFIPLVTRGKTTVMVSTPTEAEELAAFLNYCGIQDLSG